MSFGFSPSDIWTLITLTKNAYDGWRSAGERYADISETLNSFETLLSHVRLRFDELETTKGLRHRKKELERILRGCQSAVSELDNIARRYRRLGTWDRFRLGTKDLSSPKERLVRHMALLTPFVLITELESIGKDVQALPTSFDRIPDLIQGAVAVAFGNMLDSRAHDTQSTRSSVLTTYRDDDKRAFRELRRNLRSIGIRDSDIRQHRSKLIRLMQSVLDTEDGDETGGRIADEPPVTSTESIDDTKIHKAEPAPVSKSQPDGRPMSSEQAPDPMKAFQAYVESEHGHDDSDSDIGNHSGGDAQRSDSPLQTDDHSQKTQETNRQSRKTRDRKSDWQHHSSEEDRSESEAQEQTSQVKSPRDDAWRERHSSERARQRNHTKSQEPEDTSSTDDNLQTPPDSTTKDLGHRPLRQRYHGRDRRFEPKPHAKPVPPPDDRVSKMFRQHEDAWEYIRMANARKDLNSSQEKNPQDKPRTQRRATARPAPVQRSSTMPRASVTHSKLFGEIKLEPGDRSRVGRGGGSLRARTEVREPRNLGGGG